MKNKNKDFSVTIIDSSNQIGGISKTINLNGYLYDLGGHRFFSKIAEVNSLWDEILKEEFIEKKRISRILFNDKFYIYPLKINNAIYNLGIIRSFLVFLSYIKAKIKPIKPEISFEDWVTNKFGNQLYCLFFKAYTEKVWGIPCREIRAKWAAQRIKNLSLLSVIINSIRPSSKNKIKTLNEYYKYPIKGAGMMYEGMAEKIKKDSRFKLILNTTATSLNYKNNIWEVLIENETHKKVIKFDSIISTMPLPQLISSIQNKEFKEIKKKSDKLKFRGFIAVFLVVKESLKLNDNWIYIHDSNIKIGRIQINNNWSELMVKNKKYTSFCAEYFCNEGDNFWNKSEAEIINIATSELKKIKIISPTVEILQGKVERVNCAYPIYDSEYSKVITEVIKEIKLIPNLEFAGRGGMFKYNNMDHSIYTGLLAAKNIISGNKKYDYETR